MPLYKLSHSTEVREMMGICFEIENDMTHLSLLINGFRQGKNSEATYKMTPQE